jgi:hypothetical protein
VQKVGGNMMGFFKKLDEGIKGVFEKRQSTKEKSARKKELAAVPINVYPLNDEEGGYSVAIPSRGITVRSHDIGQVCALISASQVIAHPYQHKVTYHASLEKGPMTNKYRYRWDEIV